MRNQNQVFVRKVQWKVLSTLIAHYKIDSF